jgi:hypothetical protein
MTRILHFVAAAALALAPATGALAHGTHHAKSKHSASAKHKRAGARHTQESLIDRCDSMHYDQKVECLMQSRGGPTQAYMDAGATMGTGGTRSIGGGMGGSAR